MRLDDVERVHHPDDVVERSVVDRHTAVARLRDLTRERVRVHAVGEREDIGPRRHHFAHDLFAELDDAADDRDFLTLADALELALAEQILNGIAIVGRRRFRALANEHPRDRAPDRDDRTRHELREAQHRQHERRDAATASDARSLAAESGRTRTTNPANVSAFHDDGEPVAVHPDDHSRDEQRERDAGARRGEQTMRPLEVRDRRSGAAELSLGPVSQPDATHRAHGHAAGRQPGDDDERDRSAED